jgi:hypothetical protein
VEIKDTDEAKRWAGTFENHTRRRLTLTTDLDVTDEYKNYSQETWPKALLKNRRQHA